MAKKQTTKIESSIRPAIAELERLFDAFTPLFDRKLPRPVITIQSAGRLQALGWFSPQAWQDSNANALPEINLSAEHMSRDILDIAECLIHEMVHYANALDGIKDCNSSQYHNKKFQTRAIAIGLECEKMGRYGYAQTSLSEDLKVKVKATKPDAAAFALFRLQHERTKSKTKMKKWSCACTNVRCATKLNATCEECGKAFEIQE